MDAYCVPVFTEINDCFSHGQFTYVTVFKMEKTDNLYVYASENKTLGI